MKNVKNMYYNQYLDHDQIALNSPWNNLKFLKHLSYYVI